MRKIIFDSFKGVEPSWGQIKSQVTSFAKSELQASNSEIKTFLNQLENVTPFLEKINLNFKVNNKGGSAVVYYINPVGILGDQDHGVRFKLCMGGPGNYRKDQPVTISNELTMSHSDGAKMKRIVNQEVDSFLTEMKIFRPLSEPNYAEVFKYSKEDKGLESFMISFSSGIIARKRKVSGKVSGKRVIIRFENMCFLAILEEESKENFPNSTSENYPAVYKIKRLKSDIFKAPETNFITAGKQYYKKEQKMLVDFFNKHSK